MKNNIVIIGGSGLVGKALINLKDINRKFDVYIIDKQCKLKKKNKFY